MITIQQVAEKVSEITGVPVSVMQMCKGPNKSWKTENAMLARSVCYHVAWNYIPSSKKAEIARFFNRDHTTVMHLIDEAEYEMYCGNVKLQMAISQTVEELGLQVIHKSTTHLAELIQLREEVIKLRAKIFDIQNKRA